MQIVKDNESLRIDGLNAWISFYRGSTYDGFLWNNNGDIILGTSFPNTAGNVILRTKGEARMIVNSAGNIGVGSDPYSSTLFSAEAINGMDGRTGVFGRSISGSGVAGHSTSGVGIEGSSTSNYGIYGYSTNGQGVVGRSDHSIGVVGYASQSNQWDFDAQGPGIDYGSTSSRRWKTNIVNIPDPLAKLATLRGVYFDWDEAHGGRHDIGFIAEEIGEVIPEIVSYEDNGIDATSMDYSKMTPLLVEAANVMRKEYQKKFEILETEIDSLRAKMIEMESLLMQFKTVSKKAD